MAKPILCRNCLQEERVHVPGWRCEHFEPRGRRTKSRRPTSPAAPQVTMTHVRALLAQTFRYVADLLEVDASIITARSTPTMLFASPSTSKPAARVTAKPASLAPPRREGELSLSQHRVLTMIAQYPRGVTKRQIAIVTGYKRSTRNRLLGELRAAGHVTEAGSHWKATSSGIAALGDGFEPLPTGDELREKVMRELKTGFGVVLQVLIDAYPDAVDRERIDELANLARSTRNRYLQELESRQLVTSTGPRWVRAADELFSKPGVPLREAS